jgi:hypothetical protein
LIAQSDRTDCGAVGGVRLAPATSPHDVVRLVAAGHGSAAIDRRSRDRKHRFDFLSKSISRRMRAREGFQELMPRTGGRKVQGLSVSVREAFITPRKIKENTK